jgi:hypothetical protein
MVMADTKWKIKKVDQGGDDLIGCLLEQTDSGFEFKSPNHDPPLSTLSGLMPMLPFTFPDFPYEGHIWSITVEEINVGKSGKDTLGSFTKNPDRPDEEEDGSWTADGTGKGADEDESATTAYA